MITFYKNFLSIFYLILFLGLIVFSKIIYNLYTHTYEKHVTDQEHILKINSNSIESLLVQYETILNILGSDLTFNDAYKSISKTEKTLDNLLKINPSLVGFALVRPNGKAYVASTNLKNLNSLPNLLEQEETKDTFLLALKEDKLIVGRTYFHKSLNTLLIPIRKAIRDKNNKVIAVMTAGINVNKAFSFLHKDHRRIRVFRAFDLYNQLIIKKDGYDLSHYKKAVDKDVIRKYIFELTRKQKKSLQELKKTEELITFKDPSYLKDEDEEYLTSSKYMKRYGLWVSVRTPISIVLKKFYSDVFLFSFLFIFIHIVLFYLFKYIAKFERKKQKELYSQAMKDPLTNLYNKTYINYEFNKYNKKEAYTLLLIDIDNFKAINNSYGHDYGDIVLKELSLRLLKLKVNNDALVRYSSNEFLYTCELKSDEEISILANNILNIVSNKFVYKKYEFNLSSSIGISHYPKDGKNFDEVKRFANIAMDKAKKQKNTFCIFEESLKLDYLKKSLIEDELKNAIKNNEIYMTYQAQINKDGTLYGVEALVRWENKKLGFVPPDVFIKIAEEKGLMSSLGRYIIRTSLKEISALYKKLDTSFQLSINISYKQFLETDFYSDILNNVNEFNFIKKNITLEVTESIFIDDIDFILDLLKKIKEDGMKISLDDFGTGYSSLSLLKKLPINELKIDKSFVDDILFDKDALHMVEAIISIGKKLGMSILAEGVETLEQKKLLEKNNCDLFQGYLYSKPLKVNDLELFLNTIKKK